MHDADARRRGGARIAVGVIVTTADGAIVARTGLRARRAGSALIRRAALGGLRIVAIKVGRASNAGDAAAHLTLARGGAAIRRWRRRCDRRTARRGLGAGGEHK